MGLVCSGILTSADRGKPPTAPTPRVSLWGHVADQVAALSQTRMSPRLPEFRTPDMVRVVIDEAEALADADVIVSAAPAQSTREAWTRLAPHVPRGAAVVSVAKGIENGTLMRPSQIIADVLGDDPDGAPRPIGALSGPTIATELARCLPATMIAASEYPGFAAELQKLFSTSWLRVYSNPDLLGVELAGALKNVIAIAAGVLDGLQAGDNAKSALLARGLAEVVRLGLAMGASASTFFGIAGVGDLVTTCFSSSGRNRACGEALGRGEQLEPYLARAGHVVEGVATCQSAMDLAERYRIEMPITAAVHSVLFEGVDALNAISRLMSRELRDERIG